MKKKKRKAVINTFSTLYDKLLNIYTTQFYNLLVDQKKRINVLNRPENLTLDFDEDDLWPMPPLKCDEEVKLEPQETIAERVKLHLRKKNSNRFKSLDSKQIVNYTSNIISTKKSRK